MPLLSFSFSFFWKFANWRTFGSGFLKYFRIKEPLVLVLRTKELIVFMIYAAQNWKYCRRLFDSQLDLLRSVFVYQNVGQWFWGKLQCCPKILDTGEPILPQLVPHVPEGILLFLTDLPQEFCNGIFMCTFKRHFIRPACSIRMASSCFDFPACSILHSDRISQDQPSLWRTFSQNPSPPTIGNSSDDDSVRACLCRTTLHFISWKSLIGQFQVRIKAHSWMKRHGKLSFSNLCFFKI